MYEFDDGKLVPFTEELITEKYLSWFNNLTICEHTSHCIYPMTRDRAIEYIKNVNRPGSDTIVWAILICTHYQGKDRVYSHVGNVCLTSINLINRTAEIGIVIGENVRNKGIGTKVLNIVMQHGFNRLNLQRLWLGTSSLNIGMQKAALKAGMKLEGSLKNALFTNGKYVDDQIYGIIKYRYERYMDQNREKREHE